MVSEQVRWRYKSLESRESTYKRAGEKEKKKRRKMFVGREVLLTERTATSHRFSLDM
jgi:hypothetical protein